MIECTLLLCIRERRKWGRMAGARQEEVGMREGGGGSAETHLRHGVVRVVKVEALLLAAVIAWPRVCDRCNTTKT